MDTILRKLQNAILLNDDKTINILAHEAMADGQELEDLGLSNTQLDYVVGSCMRTGFPNFTTNGECKSPYLKG